MPEDIKKMELYPPWKELYDTYKEAPYGAFISYNEIVEKAKVPLYGHGWIWIIFCFKREMLRLSNRALENVRGEGYRIVESNEHTRLVYRETRRAERRVRQGVEIAVHVDYEQLNDKEKQQMTDMTARMLTLNSVMVKSAKKIKGITFHYDLPEIPRPRLESKVEQK